MTAMFSTDRIAAGLAMVPAAPLPQNPLGELFALEGATLRLARNEELYGEGEPAEHLYQLVSGTIRTCRFTADGRRQIGSFCQPGDVFGLEMGTSYRLGAEAVTEATVLMVPRSAVFAAAGRDVTLAKALWTSMAADLARAEEHLLLISRRGAVERVAAFLLALAGRVGRNALELSMSRQDIADYLGLTIETVSRTMTQLERDNLIDMLSSRRINLSRPRGLADLAEGA